LDELKVLHDFLVIRPLLIGNEFLHQVAAFQTGTFIAVLKPVLLCTGLDGTSGAMPLRVELVALAAMAGFGFRSSLGPKQNRTCATIQTTVSIQAVGHPQSLLMISSQ
jgi:hypothetical protein